MHQFFHNNKFLVNEESFFLAAASVQSSTAVWYELYTAYCQRFPPFHLQTMAAY